LVRLRIFLLHAIAYPLLLLIVVAGFLGTGFLLQQIERTFDYLLSWAPPAILFLAIAIYTLVAHTSNRLTASWQSRELNEEQQRQREAERRYQTEQAEREQEAEQHYRKYQAELEREAELHQQAERERRADQEPKPQRERQGAHDTPQHSDDWWTLLGVSADASKDDIVRGYRLKIQQYHPDRLSGLGPELIELAEKRTRALNAAYAQAKDARRVGTAGDNVPRAEHPLNNIGL